MITDFNESFDYFNSYKDNGNEYRFTMRNKIVPMISISTIIPENLYESIVGEEGNFGVITVKDEAIQRFHPNKINNKNFWIRARKDFPHISVCGAECKSIKEVNKKNFELSNAFGAYPFLFQLIVKNENPLDILEIGFGYGSLFNIIKNYCNYIGIDYIIPKSLKKYKNFIEIQKSGIPDYLLNEKLFDVIYSVNVLQHCSQKDRFDYFKQGYSVLKNGGYFIFSSIIMTKENQNEIYWGIKDKLGRGYLQFFNQLTEADYDYELYDYLQSLGFIIIGKHLHENKLSMIIQKPK